MICVQCENEEFVLKPEAELEQVFRDETLKVIAPVMVCKKCGWITLGPGQLDELRKRTADVYRKRHGLLTSAEIKDCRESLGMKQRDFAEFLNVGEASVKRWETWQVQERSSDELIRLKSQLAQVLKVSGAPWNAEWRSTDLVRVFMSHSTWNQDTVRLRFHKWVHMDLGKSHEQGKFVKLLAAPCGVWGAFETVHFAQWFVENIHSSNIRRLASGELKVWRSLLAMPIEREERRAERKGEQKGTDYEYDPDLALAA